MAEKEAYLYLICLIRTPETTVSMACAALWPFGVASPLSRPWVDEKGYQVEATIPKDKLEEVLEALKNIGVARDQVFTWRINRA